LKIRSITLFDKLQLPVDPAQIRRLSRFAQTAQGAYSSAGYEVQTLRLATSILSNLTPSRNLRQVVDDVVSLEKVCQDAGFGYISLGPVGASPVPNLPEILEAARSVFVTCHIAKPGTGVVDGEMVRFSAGVISEAAAIEGGFGNLRFAALANTPPGTPFFPAAYWVGEAPAFAVATESADLAVEAAQRGADAAAIHAYLRASVESHGQALQRIGFELAARHGPRFLGTDFSLAPFPRPETSIGAALETMTGQPLGSPGTLAAAATLTDAVQTARFQRTGFCGLMLPVLEDSVLARRAAEGYLNIGELLQWSAVCGTGLDTVPVPGDVSQEALSRVLFDVASLAVRLNKPLTARLMPLPGKSAGDPVHFDFSFFADGGVLPLRSGDSTNALSETFDLSLASYHA